MLFTLPFPVIDPVLIEIGPVAIRWYALAYIAGLLLGWRYVRRLAAGPPRVCDARDVDDFLLWATLGVVLGGRLGFIILYSVFRGPYYLENPLAILQVWQGGMAFHGGLLGVAVAMLVFCRVRRIPLLSFADCIACAAPIGLFLGRIANFINGELFGRVTDVPWAMVFPRGGPDPRHPSQLYQAGLEGLVLIVVLYLVWRRPALRERAGLLSGVFLIGYGLARAFAEQFREPDPGIPYLILGTTWAQWLSVPMLALGLWLILRARPRRA